MSTAEVRAAALKLSSEEKARLAEELLASLDAPQQKEIDAAWAQEAERRIDAIDAGAATIAEAEVYRQIEGRRR